MITNPEAKTLPQLLLEKARRAPGQAALWRKVRGVWENLSLQAYAESASEIALALRADGVETGDVVLIFGFNSPQWLMSDMAAMMCKARAASLYPDMAPAERLDILRSLAPGTVFCGGHEQVDLILEAEAAGALVGLKRIVYWDRAGLQTYADARLISLDDYRANFRADQHGKAVLLGDIETADPDEIAVVALTRGVSGRARPVELSHSALLSAGRRAASGARTGGNRRNLAFLPFASSMARQYSATLHLLTGEQLVFAEEGQGLVEAMQEVQPHTLALFPNGWMELAAALVNRLEQTPKLPSRLRLRALRKPGAWLEQALFHRGMRRYLGLGHIDNAICFGGTADHETRAILDKLGIPLLYGYGVTELGGVTHLSATVSRLLGCPLPDVATSADSAGQICIAADDRPFIYTGDRFEDPAEALALGGRIEDMHSAKGCRIALNRIEDRVRDSRWIRHAAACVASDTIELLIEIDAGTIGRWAADRKIPFTNFASLASRPEVRELVSSDIARQMGDVAGAEFIKRHVLLEEPLDLDAGELAPLYGLRRGHVAVRRVQAEGGK